MVKNSNGMRFIELIVCFILSSLSLMSANNPPAEMNDVSYSNICDNEYMVKKPFSDHSIFTQATPNAYFPFSHLSFLTYDIRDESREHNYFLRNQTKKDPSYFNPSGQAGIGIAGSFRPDTTERSQENNRTLTLVCPDDISIYTDINTCTSYVTGNLNAFYAGDDLFRLTWEMTGATQDASSSKGFNQIHDYTFNEGTTIIAYTLEDNNGNAVSCSFSVTISDNQVPRIDYLPENRVVNTAPGECDAVVYWNHPVASDNCTPGEELRWIESHQPGSAFPEGITEITYSRLRHLINLFFYTIWINPDIILQ